MAVGKGDELVELESDEGVGCGDYCCVLGDLDHHVCGWWVVFLLYLCLEIGQEPIS